MHSVLQELLHSQSLVNDFKPFGSVMTKIKNRKIDPSYEIQLGLYQAITGPAEEDKIFKNVSRDFFDLIVIDECHRGISDSEMKITAKGVEESTANLIQKGSLLQLTIKDDGVGFDTSKKNNGVGITNIKTRIRSFINTRCR